MWNGKKEEICSEYQLCILALECFANLLNEQFYDFVMFKLFPWYITIYNSSIYCMLGVEWCVVWVRSAPSVIHLVKNWVSDKRWLCNPLVKWILPELRNSLVIENLYIISQCEWSQIEWISSRSSVRKLFHNFHLYT